MNKLGRSTAFKAFVFFITIALVAVMLMSFAMMPSASRAGALPVPFTQGMRLGEYLQNVNRDLGMLDKALAGSVPPGQVVELRTLPEVAPSVDMTLYAALIESNLSVVYFNEASGILLTNADVSALQTESAGGTNGSSGVNAPNGSNGSNGTSGTAGTAGSQLADRLLNQVLSRPFAFLQDFRQGVIRTGGQLATGDLPPQFRSMSLNESSPRTVRIGMAIDTAFTRPDMLSRLLEADWRDRNQTILLLAAFVISGILLVLAWAFLIRYAGWAGQGERVRLSWLDRVHGEILLIGCAVLALMFIVLQLQFRLPLIPQIVQILLVLYVIGGGFLLTLVRRQRAGIMLSQTIVGSFWLLLKRFYENRPLFWKVLAAYAAFGFLALACAVVLSQGNALRGLATLVILLLLPAALFLLPLVRWSVQFQKVSQATDRMGLDTFQIDEPMERLHPDLRHLALSLSSTHERMQRAIAEQMKSERLKTDLISNVSHDLKTPLTSIISYIDLLRQEQDDPEKRQAYLEVLEQKAQRLKNLTESLFEAAKASSGSLPVQREPVNLNELVQQVSGEYADRLAGQRLALVLAQPDDGEERPAPIELISDGGHIWRILDNLMANACKYALEGTRIYLDLRQDDRFARIELKNISRDRLERTGEELLQRFVRGDESRHTEGSGLGLSIASSLSGLLGGSLDIRTDGDLFKATVSLPLS